MSQSLMTAAEVQELMGLVWTLSGESFTSAEEARLEELVCGRSDGQWLYVRAVDLVADLHWCFTSEADVVEDLTSLMFDIEETEPADADSRVEPVRPRRDHLIERRSTPMPFSSIPWVGGAVRRLHGVAGRSSLVSMLLVAVAFYGTFGLLAWNLRPYLDAFATGRGRDITGAAVARLEEPGSSNPGNAAKSTGLAVLADATNADWETAPGESTPSIGGALPADRELRLAAGTARLNFARGAFVTLEGPAQFKVLEAGRGHLTRGRLRAHVPPEAVGFTIETPMADVVDLGTEFDVEVDSTGCANLMVLVGEVAVHPVQAKRVVMKAGESGRIDAHGIRPISPDQKQLATAGGLSNDIDLVVDGKFEVNWNMAELWSSGRAPAPYGHYHVGRTDAKRVRTSIDSSAASFTGGALTIHPSGELAIKYSRTTRVTDLRLDGGQLFIWDAHKNAADFALAGNLQVVSNSGVQLNGCRFALRTRLTGNGGMHAIGPGKLQLETDSQGFHGRWRVENAHLIAATLGSLGDGDVTVMGSGVLEPQYELKNLGATLELQAGASLVLKRPLTFGRVLLAGQALVAGKYTLAQLQEQHPDFFSGTDGSLTVADSSATDVKPSDGPQIE